MHQAIYKQDKNLYEYLVENAQKNGEAKAVVQNDRNMTFLQLHLYSNAFANYLCHMGIEQKSRIAVILPRNMDLIVVLYAIEKCGCTYVPIHPDYPLARKQYIIQDAGCNAIIAETIFSMAEDVISVDISRFHVEEWSSDFICRKCMPDDISYIIYTSGSSGMPKGVMIKQYSVINLIESINRQYGINETTKGLCITSITFDLSVYDVFGILAAGGSIYLAKEEEIANMQVVKKILIEENINFWNSVPTTMVSLIHTFSDKEKNALPRMKHVFLSGDWIIPASVIRMQELMPNAKITSLGGATEATVWSIYYDIDAVQTEWSSIPYGKPLDNQEFYILDECKLPVEDNEIGELYIGGDGVAEGYVNNPEKTRIAFVENPFDSAIMYRTGDLGRRMQDGNIEFLGRKDAQVKIRGFRVELMEIENNLMNFSSVQTAVVSTLKNERDEKFICAYIKIHPSFELKKLKNFLKSNLPDYMLPSIFIKIEELPLSSNGKIDRSKLPKPSVDNILTEKQYSSPQHKNEEKILKLWQKVLTFKEIGVDFDFFEIGGTSLDCITLEQEMKESGIQIPYQDLMKYTTIRQQSALVMYGEDAGKASQNQLEGLLTKCNLDSSESKVKPFNTIYYKNCFYNSLFPVLIKLNKDINYILTNDAITYGIKTINGFGCIYPVILERKPLKQLIEDLGIKAEYTLNSTTEAAFENIDAILGQDGFAIIWVDSYYEPNRRDVFQKTHFAHTLLVYGRRNNDYIVLEQSHKDALNYKELLIDSEILREAYLGYQKNLKNELDEYTLITFLKQTTANRYQEDHEQRLSEWYKKNQQVLLDGIANLTNLDYQLADNVDTLEQQLQYENEILDLKRSERYRAQEMGLANLDYDRIIQNWEEIRNDTIRYKKGLKEKVDLLKKHRMLLDEIYSLEKDILCRITQ